MDKRTVEMELLEHKRLLEGLQLQVEGGLRDAPEGFLRVVTNNSGRTQYYVKNKSDGGAHPQGHYLKKENITLANRIAQRDYDESMLAEIKKEIKVIDSYLNKAKRKEIYWEHMGMMSNSEYCKSAIKKINTYTRNGYKYGEDIIFTYESAEAPLDTYVIDLMIDTYLI